MKRVAQLPARVLINDLYYAAVEAFPRWARPLGRTVARGLIVAVPKWRRVLQQNARLALGPRAPQGEVERVALAMLTNMQFAIAEILHAQQQTAEELCARVTRFSGRDSYLHARRNCRGLVVAGAHMGAFEPCLAHLRQFEPRVHVLFQPDPMPRFERARSRLRTSLGVVEHHAESGVAAWAALREALLANEVVVLHADRAMPFQRPSRIRFLDADDAMLPMGPARLALSCGSALVPTFCFRHDDGLEIAMADAIQCECADLRAAEVAAHPAQRALTDAMERAIRTHPEQWMAFGPILEARA